MMDKKTSAYLPTFAEPTLEICLADSTLTRYDRNLNIRALGYKNSALTYSSVSVLNRLDAVGDFTGFLDVVNDRLLVGICGYVFLNPFWIQVPLC